ncbi:MAG: T9SS type A sorting domain-containing protein [Candidatus Aegiribacteria sp.]
MKYLSMLVLFSMSVLMLASETVLVDLPEGLTDVRPEIEEVVHRIGNLGSLLVNVGLWGDPWGDSLSMEWPIDSENNYLWSGDFWSCCYGNITPQDSAARYASCSDYGEWELIPSEGWPLLYETPGGIAPEQSQYGADDWETTANYYPYGLGVFVQNYSWDNAGYDNFIAAHIAVTHHSEHGNPGVQLEGLLVAVKGDCDVASADEVEPHLDDMVYYDGHAIWCNDPEATFEYQFDDGDMASTQDDYTYQQNPDNPLPPGDPENIYYYYNYSGSDGIPDNDVDQNGVSDHFTILAKVTGGDTLYITDPGSGVTLFNEGMPENYFNHTVGDTTFLVVPRNLSYMWDSDDSTSADDDSGEPLLTPYCNGFIGWRLLDIWIVKEGGGVERPCDVYGSPIPISHCWWNWESDPGTDFEIYRYMWGKNADSVGTYSGPTYMADWVGNPNTPDAMQPINAGPFPFVFDAPVNLGYPAFDYRFLQSVGPVELADGDTLHVIGGWVMGLGLDGLRMNADLMLDAYWRDGFWGDGLRVEAKDNVFTTEMSISPNPVTSIASISLNLAYPGRVSVNVYDLSGRVVDSLADTELPEGENTLNLDASNYETGVYFVRASTEGGTATTRFLVLN